jgi:hypothetical protein
VEITDVTEAQEQGNFQDSNLIITTPTEVGSQFKKVARLIWIGHPYKFTDYQRCSPVELRGNRCDIGSY